MIKVIMNADDFGFSKSINEGIIYAFKQGLITTTTIMINMPYVDDAINLWKQNKDLGIGLHINLTAGRPISNDVKSLIDGNGEFLNHKLLESSKVDVFYDDVLKEINAQIDKLILMIGKENIDHLDCHHFIFRNPIIKKAMIEIAKENNWYLRTTDEFREEALQHSVKTNDYFCESFYDETATSDTMLSYFKTVKDDSLVEVMTHCGLIDEDTRNRTKYTNREHEIKQLIVLKELGFYKKYNFIKCKNLTK